MTLKTRVPHSTKIFGKFGFFGGQKSVITRSTVTQNVFKPQKTKEQQILTLETRFYVGRNSGD